MLFRSVPSLGLNVPCQSPVALAAPATFEGVRLLGSPPPPHPVSAAAAASRQIQRRGTVIIGGDSSNFLLSGASRSNLAAPPALSTLKRPLAVAGVGERATSQSGTTVMTYASGRHFLQIPGPTNVPDRVLRAMARPTIDHRGPEFGVLGREVLSELRPIFKTTHPVIVYPASGTGAWEAALVNTLSPGDAVLMVETGWFATLWQQMATKLGLQPELIPTDWRRGADPAAVEARLAEDRNHSIKAVCVVHNETSTGVASRIGEVRKAIDRARHPALLLVDTISSLGSIDFRMDEWKVDVAVGGSQKGLMLPIGMGFTGVSKKALDATQSATLPAMAEAHEHLWCTVGVHPHNAAKAPIPTPEAIVALAAHQIGRAHV